MAQATALRKTTSQWVAAMDVLRSEMPISHSRAFVREVFAAFLLLRWADLHDAEQEAMAIFEDRAYQPLLPPPLQWRHWSRMEQSSGIAERLRQLPGVVEGLRDDVAHPLAAYLRALVEPLRRVLQVNFVYLIDLVRWVGELPFDTPGERRAVLDVFDQVLAETSDAHDGQFATPANIARLVAALADPQPGERVYDPCFGSGNFLVAAWQQVERSRSEQRRAGTLLEVAGIEIDAGAFLVGLTRMLLAGIDSPRLQRGDSLEREAPGSPDRQGFDVVLANPPIGAKLGRDAIGRQHFAFPTMDSAGLFVQHALAQLRPRGRAVIALPEGFLFRAGAERELRRHLLQRGHVEAVIGLPAGAFAPYTNVKGCLLVLNKQGGANRVRMADAGAIFESRTGRKAPEIRAVMAEQLAREIRRALPRPTRELPPGIPEGTAGSGVLARSVWEVSVEELAAAEWDLSPRRREKGGLNDLLGGIKDALGESASVAPLSSVARVFAGRSIRSADLLHEQPLLEQPVAYVRIKDLSQGKVGRASSWLRPELAGVEKRWALLPGDVLVSKSGTIGKAALVRNGAVGAVAANGLYVLRADPKRLDAGFLLAYLASPACQSWLAAQSRGAVIQHLNRAVFDDLPVPLPPLALQGRAAAQFREFGTDALAFLAQAVGGSDADRLTAWLAEFDGKLPKFVSGLEDTPSLSHFEPLIALASTAQRWLDQEQIGSQAARWLAPLCEALLPLAGVADIPAGPGLVTVLQAAQTGLRGALEQADGHAPAEAQARAVIERLRDWLRAATLDMFDLAGIEVRAAPSSLAGGSFAEFTVELENPAALPLRNVRVRTEPDWGGTEVPYVPEGGTFPLHLRGDVPKRGGIVTLRVLVEARTLTGEVINGEIELPLRVTDDGFTALGAAAELSGNPYVVGDPLSPQHGHGVFFGRDDLIRKIGRQITAHGNVVLLEGNRRAGKTSILRHLEGCEAIPGWLAVYSSLTAAEGDQHVAGVPTPEIFRALAHSIATALCKLAIDVPLPDGQVIAAGQRKLGLARLITGACKGGIGTESPFADFRDYLDAALQALEPQGLGLVLMLDEFDKLQEGIDNGVTSRQVPDNIRYLIQSYPRFSAILTGSRRLKRQREAHWSALYGLGTTVQVAALDPESARKVVTEPVRDQLAFSQEAVDRVLEVTARHPYLIQCLCNCIFDFAVRVRSRSITASAVNDSARDLLRSFEYFTWLWNDPQGPATGRHRRQLILMLCARSFKDGSRIDFGTLSEQLVQAGVEAETAALDADLSHLREMELVSFTGEIGGGEYRLAIPLMADWIAQHQDAEIVAGRAQMEAEEEDV